MIASDLVRAVVALGFIFGVARDRTWLLYVLSGALMFACPFFTSGRAAMLPSIATQQELHTANSLTQLTQWSTVTVGSFLGGAVVTAFGYKLAVAFNAFSFLFSAWCISGLRVEKGFRPKRVDLAEDKVVRPWREYMQGLRYMRSSPLILGIGLVAVGWGPVVERHRFCSACSAKWCFAADLRVSARSGERRESAWSAAPFSRIASDAVSASPDINV